MFSKILNRFNRLYFLIKSILSCLKVLFKSFGKDILILDLDNTIILTADWLYENESKDLELAYENAKVNYNLVQFLYKKYPKKSFIYFIISARHYKNYRVTKAWIKNNLQLFSPIEFTLVGSAKKKIFLYQIFNFKKLIVFDDLTYNHENKSVMKYNKLEQYLLNKKNVELYSYSFLKSLK